ncbi:transcriptional regulator [Planococcus sp. MB-3u-03]|nr:transcriptional regulator [Planococcus sp. MB-3u-03]
MKNNVKITRMKLSITQEQLANRVGATRQTIGLIEKDNITPAFIFVSIAKELGKTLTNYFGRSSNHEILDILFITR